MIPQEVSDLADLIFAEWRDADDATFSQVVEAAWRVYHAGFRKIATSETMQ